MIDIKTISGDPNIYGQVYVGFTGSGYAYLPAQAGSQTDTTAPSAPTIASFTTDSGVAGDHITNDTTLTLSGTAEANATVKVYDGATLLGSAVANGSGAWTYTTGTLTNGAHSLMATASDAAGNTGVASVALAITIDTTAPVAPVITSFTPDTGAVGDGITTANVLTLSGTAEANATVKIFDGATLLNSVVANASGAWSYTTAALSNGAHSLTATATDAAGNTGVASSALAITVTPPPGVPTIASFTTDSGVVGDHITNDSTLTLSGSAVANSTVNIFDGATLLNSVVASASGAWSYTTAALSNGAHSFTATDTISGVTSAASTALSVTIDTTAPVAPTITSFSPDTGTVGDGITTANVLTLSGTAEANATVKIFDGATLLNSVVANASGAWSYTTAALSNGAHSLTATATDAAGNTGVASSALAITVTPPPGVPTIASFTTDSGVVGDHITNDSTLTLSGSAVANSTVNIFDGATLLNSVVASASGAWSYTTAALSNGAHSFTATDTISGVTSAASTALSVTIDTVAPVAPTVASFTTDSGVVGDHITNDSTLTLSGTAEANATVNIFDDATLLNSVVASASGAWNYTTAALSDGAHSLTATATDAAGNTGVASTALSVTIDTTAPVAPVITSFTPDTGTVGDGITTANVLTLSGTAEANATVKIFDGATLLNSVVANASGAWSYTTAALSNGAHSLTATATDAAGNTGVASSALAITVTPPPGVPTIASFTTDSGVVGDHITNDSTLTLSGSAVANSTVNIFDGATLLNSVVASASGAWSYTTAALSNGAHSFTATDTISGVTSAASTALSVTIDTTAPVAPTITSFSPDTGTVGDGITTANVLTLSGTAEANATVKIFDGATLLNSVVANASGAWSYTTAALSNGAHSLTATATDAAGNTGVASSALAITVTPPPGVPTIASFTTDSGVVGDHITNDSTLTLSGSAVANSTVNIFDGATLLNSVVASASGAWSYTTAALSNGAHSFTATDTISGVTSAASTALSVTIDTVAPVAPTVASFTTDSGVVGDHITNDSTLTLSGTAEANATVNIFDDATLLNSVVASASGAWNYTTAALSDGAHSLTATATDAAGNTGVASTALSVTIDTTAPVAPVITSDAIVNTNRVQLTGTAEANSTVTVFNGTALLGSATADGSGVWNYTTGPLSNGPNAFTATASDAAGNVSSVSQLWDPIIGGTVIEAHGAISLTQVGDQYYLDNSIGAIPPSLKFFGNDHLASVVPANWAPIGAEKTASGYEVAWKMAGADQYTVWNTDTNGNYVSNIGQVSGTSYALESLEASFNQDLNGDGHIGLVTTAIETQGATDLTQVADHYFLSDSLGSGPSLKYGGTDFVAGQFGGWAPIGAEKTASGYEVAWKMAGADQYTVWNTDNNGNYVSNAVGVVSGGSYGLESLETGFNQDLNGDGHIGLVTTAIETQGATDLTQVADHCLLCNSLGSGPSLKYGGMDFVAGQFGGWTPIGAEKTASGYEVAWKMAGADQYTVWNTDNNGNYVSNAVGVVSGGSYGLESLETGFNQDLNGDGHIGLVTTAIETNGATSLTQAVDHFLLYDNLGSGPSLKYGGMDFVAGQFGGWTPIGAEKTASGYEVAWKMAGTDQYTVWNTDNNGNYVSNAVGVVPGGSYGLESLETGFNQDLNGDGHIGLVTTAIETNGATSLTQAVDHFLLYDNLGSGPSLKYGGMDFVAGQFGGWTPIGAEKTASGYEVAWKDASSGQYTAWNTDNNGNYVSNAVGVVPGTSSALESLETSFNQDLNKDGYIGLVLNGSSGGQTLNASSSPTTLIGGPNDILNGGTGADTFVFPTNFGSNTVKNFTPGTDALQFSQAMFANVAAVLSDAQQVGSNVVVTHDPQNVVTLQNMQLSNLHASDIHIV